MSAEGQSMGSPPSNQRSATRQRPCNNWKQGYCRFGVNCKFQHDSANQPVPRGGSRRNSNQQSGPDRPESTINQPSGSGSTNAVTGNRKTNRPNHAVTCRDWKAGNCPRGDNCRFRHEDEPTHTKIQPSESSSAGLVGSKNNSDDAHQKNRTRTLEGRAERDGPEQGERMPHPARTEAEKWENGEMIAREQADREAREKERQTGEALRMEAERQARVARLARERAELEVEEMRRQAQEQARRTEEASRLEAERLRKLAAEKVARQARAEALRQERARKAEEERKRKEAEKLAREKAEAEARVRRQVQMQAQREREAGAIEQYIVLDSSLVTCCAGLNIRHVVTGFDLCKITIKNLPKDAKRAEIADLFLHQGVESSEFFIFQVKPDASGSVLEAVILANAEHGQTIALGLQGIEFRNRVLSFSVSDNASGNAMDTPTRNSPFLLVSWRAPSETLIATYSSMEEAQEKARKLNQAIWRGRQISAVMNDRPQGVAALRHFVPSSVKIMGLPPGVPVDADLVEFTGTWNLKMLKSISFDLPFSFHTIRQHLTNSPGVRMGTYETLGSGEQASGEAKVKVLFDEWEAAKEAYASIGQIRLGPNSPRFRAWLPPKPLLYTIKITRQQYEAQKKQWDALSEKKPGSDAHVQPRIGERGDVFIQVLGQDKKAAGSLKVRVESMVSGEKLDASYWHSSFGSQDGRAFFNRLYGEKKVFVRNDFKTRSLRVYGEPEAVLDVRDMIKHEVERLAGRDITRTLDQSCIGFFVREGLGKLTELLGEGNVSLNLSSRPCKITVKGGEEAIHHLHRLMDESRGGSFLGAALPGRVERELCPICTDDVSNPEQLGCGHTYCAGCLKHFLTSAADTKTFPLVCMGNDATCNVPISIPFIRRFLPAPIFQSLVEAAFLSYLDQHPQELKYCTTPDCKQMYRHREEPTVLQCPSCFSTICAACDEEAHDGMTCQERRLHKNPAEQERLNEQLAAANGYKKCPQCKVWIEKTEGCNHMSCKCGAHICWRCMGIFDRATIYQHMQTAHGNIYDEVPAGVNVGNAANNVFLAGQVDELARIERERERTRQPVMANQPGLAPRRFAAYGGQMGQYGQQEEERRRQAEAARRVNERWRLEAEQAAAARRRQADEQTRQLLQERQPPRQEEERRGWCVVM
ncbi:hypothetical protein GALMADRAFT_91633 [Galerina marginata CBS 339.88]|uniref:RBR-type E3 ubiquitin transferase n=1 Tax=Galerina marginata (strain CBS 339.88) TaxID=685588 RepID=A0A067TM42_GALM3|nr:hypothetical protein GALMADRAFT_91633 [Galerina marginata CBS 339.88]